MENNRNVAVVLVVEGNIKKNVVVLAEENS